MDDHPLRRLPRRPQLIPSGGVPVSRRAALGFALTAAFLSHPAEARKSRQNGLFAPVRLVIPAVGIDAEIEQVHIVDGVMQTPRDPWHVGWYSQLSFPGQGLNVVIAGHKDWWDVGPVVFQNLTDLSAGDEITLFDQSGAARTYQVSESEQLAVATPPTEYTGTRAGEQLTLITCSGSFDGQAYDERLIVRANPA